MKNKLIVNLVTNLVLVFVLVAVASVSFFTGSTNVFVDNSMQPYYKGADKPCVSLMINVYWGTEYIVPMLDILDKYQAKATFFVGGDWVSKNAEVLTEIVVRGHEIGNHGYFHKNHEKLTYEQNCNEIIACQNLVMELCGIKTILFAPPSGAFSKVTLKSACDNGYKTIMWSKDTIDWRDKDANLVYTRATKGMGNGDLVLMHPTKHTLAALPKILQYCNQNKLSVVTVSCNINGEI